MEELNLEIKEETFEREINPTHSQVLTRRVERKDTKRAQHMLEVYISV